MSRVVPAADRPPEPKLDSWKQIAAHLKREVRTAQRWEKSEGLPVHRHRHGRRDTVFAYRSELDAWLETRTAGPSGSATAPELGPRRVPAPRGDLVAQAPAEPAARPLLVGLLLLLLAAPILWLIGRTTGEVPAAGAPPESASVSRLLVLPLIAIGDEPLEHSTARALHDELITGLAGLAPERLAVIGRTSALRYGSAGLGLAEIGDALGVAHVLEGSVRRIDDGLHVTTRLVRASQQSEVWSAAFDVEHADLARQERRVVGAVCEALARELLGGDAAAPTGSDVDPLAREAWLRGRYLWHKGTPEGLLASLPHFERALELAPGYVDAHVGLASAYTQLGRYGNRPAHAVFPRGKTAAARALELDPRSAEAHTALALVHVYYEWDFDAAARAFDTALRLGPELALTHHAYAHFLSLMGLHERALVSARRARTLEPLWPLVIADTAWLHYRARDFEGAAAESRRALELEPGMASAALCLVDSLRHMGDERGAWSEMRSYLDARGLLAEIPGTEGGEPELALRSVRLWNRAQVERRAREGFVSTHSQVFSLSGLDRDEELLDWLESSLESRDRVALLTLVHPAFDELRDEPRFRSVVRRVGFPDDPSRLIRRSSDG